MPHFQIQESVHVKCNLLLKNRVFMLGRGPLPFLGGPAIICTH